MDNLIQGQRVRVIKAEHREHDRFVGRSGLVRNVDHRGLGEINFGDGAMLCAPQMCELIDETNVPKVQSGARTRITVVIEAPEAIERLTLADMELITGIIAGVREYRYGPTVYECDGWKGTIEIATEAIPDGIPACAITDDETEEWRVDERDPDNSAPWVPDWTGANEGTANKVMGMVLADRSNVEMVRKVHTTSKARTMGVVTRGTNGDNS